MAEKFDLDSLEDELAKEEGVSRRDYIAKGKSKERTSLLKKNKAGIQLENTKTKAEKEAEMQKAKSVAKNIAYISLHCCYLCYCVFTRRSPCSKDCI